jgi:hypothetical protein
VVVPSGAKDDLLALRIVAGLDGKTADACVHDGYVGGCIVARRALRYLPHEGLRVPVVLRASCRDIACPSQGGQLMTCVDGACAPATIDDPSACEGDGCGESVLDGGATTRDGGSGDESVLTPPNGDGAPDVEAGPSPWRSMAGIDSIGMAGRDRFACAWSGSEMYVWGGWCGNGCNGANDGATYDPALDRWTALPPTTLGAAVDGLGFWTGSSFLVWAGNTQASVGALYDPSQHQWSAIAPPPASFMARDSAAVTWSPATHEMIIWGGDNGAGPTILNDGAAYKPSTNTWRTIAASPLSSRTQVHSVWSGSTVVVFGGNGSTWFSDAASYDPVSDTWTQPITTTLAGRESGAGQTTDDGRAFFWGGRASTAFLTDGAVFDGRASTWTLVPSIPSSLGIQPPFLEMSWFAHGRFWFFGGYALSSGNPALSGGASFDLQSMQWNALPPGGPSARSGGCAVWTGTEAIIWGGAGSAYLADGARFRP